MDFFGAQDNARKKTKFLVLYFILAIAGIIASLYFIAILTVNPKTYEGSVFWHADTFAIVTVTTLCIVGGATLFKIIQLRGGGGVVARSMGGREVDPSTTDPLERRLLNVVEEMAIASGVPVPEIYIMDHESGINGFAAGYTPNDAAIAVTRGCLENLTRDELQGVIAHEFSHILNGDMRLNIRLIGILFGIFAISFIGRVIFELALRSTYLTSGRRSNRDSGNGTLAFMALGGAIFVVGIIGVFFGRMIQSAVSRQREYLADAAAVQFTRDPQTIAGALRRIGYSKGNTTLQSAHALDAAHMFFANGLSTGLNLLFSTHPPIAKRIKSVDPSWDGTYLKPLTIDQKKKQKAVTKSVKEHTERQTRMVGALLSSIGSSSPQAVAYAQTLRENLPDDIDKALHRKDEVYYIVAALILDEKEENRPEQYKIIESRVGPVGVDKVKRTREQLDPYGNTFRIPVLNLAIPMLRRYSESEYRLLINHLNELAEADNETSIFEYVLLRIIRHTVGKRFDTNVSQADTNIRNIAELWESTCLILSALAYCGAEDLKSAQQNFNQGMKTLPEFSGLGGLVPFEQIKFKDLDKALDHLSNATFPNRKRILEAAVETVTHDGVTTSAELELLRGIAISINCPSPPV